MLWGKRRKSRKTLGLAVGLIGMQIVDAEKHSARKGEDIQALGRRMLDKYTVGYIHGALMAATEVCGLPEEDEETGELWRYAIDKLYPPAVYGADGVERVMFTLATNSVLEEPDYSEACGQGRRDTEAGLLRYKQGTSLGVFLKTGRSP